MDIIHRDRKSPLYQYNLNIVGSGNSCFVPKGYFWYCFSTFMGRSHNFRVDSKFHTTEDPSQEIELMDSDRSGIRNSKWIVMMIPTEDLFDVEVSANYSGPNYGDLPMEVWLNYE